MQCHWVYEAFINCIPFRQRIQQAAQKFSEFELFFIWKNEDGEFQVRKFIKIYLMEVKFLCAMPTMNAWCIQNLFCELVRIRTNTRKFINNLQRFVFSTKQMHACTLHWMFNCSVYLPFKYSHQIHTFSMQSSRFSKWTTLVQRVFVV